VSVLADWIDVRVAIVHEWHGRGMSVDEIARRLTADDEAVRAWLRAAPLPLPGSSRALVAELRRRVADLERALYEAELRASAPAPAESQCRALAPKG
jgi:transposase-like protein